MTKNDAIHSIQILVDSLTNPYLKIFRDQALLFGIDITYLEKTGNLEESHCLFFEENILNMQDDTSHFHLDWLQDFERHKRMNYAPRKEPLAKAIGKCSEIIDATMGTGKDTILLLSFGYKVCAYERNPFVFLLALSAYMRICDRDSLFKECLSINFGECISVVSKTDTVYYDPMYPEKKKKALPRKEMQVFKNIVGPDSDVQNYYNELTKRVRRVVLKRPLKSEILQIPQASLVSFKGKSTRYDRYDAFA